MFTNIKMIFLLITAIGVSAPGFVVAQDSSPPSDEDIKAAFYKELKLLDGLQVYNQQVQLQINSQEKLREKLQQAMVTSKSMERELLPLMVKIVDALELFIDSDIPFKKDERVSALQQLKSYMVGPDAVLSEQYRQIFSLYEIEGEYGRSYEAYSGSVTIDNKTLAVDYLRVGRLGFYYQTKDGRVSAMWNNTKSQWVTLPEKYNRHIRKAIRVASKTIAPELVNLPLIAPENI